MIHSCTYCRVSCVSDSVDSPMRTSPLVVQHLRSDKRLVRGTVDMEREKRKRQLQAWSSDLHATAIRHRDLRTAVLKTGV